MEINELSIKDIVSFTRRPLKVFIFAIISLQGHFFAGVVIANFIIVRIFPQFTASLCTISVSGNKPIRLVSEPISVGKPQH